MPAYQTVKTAERAHTAPASPSIGALRPWEPVEWWHARNVMVGQDTLVPYARRPVLTFGLDGSDDWPFPDSATSGTAPDYADFRVVHTSTDCPLTPGSFLRLHVLYCPSGITSDNAISPTLLYPLGTVRLTVTWTASDATTSGPHTYDLDLPAVTDDGELPTTGGALWGYTYEAELTDIFPPGADTSKATAATYSEGCTASIAISIQGGARVIDGVLYEYPLRHVQKHDQTSAVSVHGAVVGNDAPESEIVGRPQTRKRNSSLHTERRWGSNQTLRTAAQQTQVLGPRILAWTPWLSDGASYAAENSLMENDVEPVIISGTTNLTELISSATAYDATAPGWLVHASHAQLHKYSDPDNMLDGGGRAVVPVRVQVRARWTGTTQGLVRVQSSATEYVDVVFTNSGTKETLECIGWLETQPAADTATAVLQAFGQNTHAGDDLEVYAVIVDWGWDR